MRKATFYISTINNLKTYTPVNKRAKALTRSAITPEKLKAFAEAGANVYVWTDKGLRQSVRG